MSRNPAAKRFAEGLPAQNRQTAVAVRLIALDACADIFKPAECVNYFAASAFDTG
jgi:hypothetical protein